MVTLFILPFVFFVILLLLYQVWVLKYFYQFFNLNCCRAS